MVKISVIPEKYPSDKLEAETVAWGAIRGWFESNKCKVPEFVRNVQFEDIKDFHWDVLPLSSSADCCK